MTGAEYVVDWLTKVMNDWKDVSRKPFIGSSEFMRKADAIEDYLRQGLDPQKTHDNNIVYVIEALEQDLVQLSGTYLEQKEWSAALRDQISRLKYEQFRRKLNS